MAEKLGVIASSSLQMRRKLLQGIMQGPGPQDKGLLKHPALRSSENTKALPPGWKPPNRPAQVSAAPALRTVPRTLTRGRGGRGTADSGASACWQWEPFQEGFLEEALPWVDLGRRAQEERRAAGRGAEVATSWRRCAAERDAVEDLVLT